MARLSPERIEWSFFKYSAGALNGSIIMKLGQLWFLPVLLIVCLMNYPLLAFSRRRRSQLDVTFEDFKYYQFQLVNIALWTMLCYLLIKNKDEFYEQMVPMSLVLVIGYTVFFAFQMYLQKLPKNLFNGAILLNLIGPMISIGLNFYKD